jgi:ketosteroid isomerase-like protein
MPPSQRERLEVVVAWIDALRRGDLDALASLLHADVVWRGVPADAICRGRDDVLAVLRERLAEGLPDVTAIELVAGESAVTLGVRAGDLREVDDVPLPGQVFNVLRVQDGLIVAMEDHALRDSALAAAGASPPEWA